MTAALHTINGADFDIVVPRISHAIVMVDSATARRWLAHNRNNRNQRPTVVERYRADMASGRWSFAGDPIRFDIDGNLLDGQHRLTALAGLSTTLPMLVIRGLPAEAQSVMDQGTKRTAGDQLGLAGVKNANRVAAAVRQFIIWREGLLFRDNRVRAAVSAPRIQEWVATHPDESDYINRIDHHVRQVDAAASITGAAVLQFWLIDHDDADAFIRLLAKGGTGSASHPVNVLDKRLGRIRREHMRMSERDYLGLFIQAWNAYRAGRQLTQFLRPAGGAWTADNFPEPK